jgi:CubicO group peptidase (beta-lactamase class C family)
MVPTDAPTKTPDRRWGIGLMSYRNEGLGPGTIGHGAASGATLRIDPANDLVIVMARNSIGRNYWKYHAQFLRTVGECVEGRN